MKDARFYFGNLISDVVRCTNAALGDNDERFRGSLARAQKTLNYLRHAQRPEAYEEGLLLLRALALARARGTLSTFRTHLTSLALSFTAL